VCWGLGTQELSLCVSMCMCVCVCVRERERERERESTEVLHVNLGGMYLLGTCSSRPGLHSKYLDSQSYTWRPCLKHPQNSVGHRHHLNLCEGSVKRALIAQLCVYIYERMSRGEGRLMCVPRSF
jgi:hypothetical protein